MITQSSYPIGVNGVRDVWGTLLLGPGSRQNVSAIALVDRLAALHIIGLAFVYVLV